MPFYPIATPQFSGYRRATKRLGELELFLPGHQDAKQVAAEIASPNADKPNRIIQLKKDGFYWRSPETIKPGTAYRILQAQMPYWMS